jgi:hypothetical protein
MLARAEPKIKQKDPFLLDMILYLYFAVKPK